MPRPTVPVALEVNAAISVPGLERATSRLTDELSGLLRELGLPGDVDVSIARPSSGRAAAVRVHGALRPCSRRLMLRAWRAVAPPGLHDLTRWPVQGVGGLPDAWIRLAANDHPERVIDLVWRVALEAIKARPSCLVGHAQAETYAGETAVPMDWLPAALGRLLELGISLRERDTILETLTTAHQLGLGPDDSVEAAFDQMRADHVEVSLSPSYLALGAPAEPLEAELTRRLPIMEATMAADLGLDCPRLELSPRRDLGNHMMAVRVNDATALIPILRPDELLVAESPTRLEQLGIVGRTFPNPTTGRDCLVVGDSVCRELERLQLTFWTAAGLVPLVVYSELWRVGHRVIGSADVQRQLARIQRSEPALVAQALRHFTVRDIVRVMRGLVAETIAPMSLETILELLVTFATVGRDDDHLVLFDDRPPMTIDRSQALLRWVRAGLRRRLTEQWTGGGGWDFVVACRLSAEEEARVADDEDRPLSDGDREALVASLWDQLALAPPAADSGPILLTNPRARAAVRALVQDDLPDTQVVAISELQPGIRVHQLSTTEGCMNAQISTTAERVRGFLERLAGAAVTGSDKGRFDVIVDDVPVKVEVVAHGEETIVVVSTFTNHEVGVTTELLRWLVERPDDSWFAHLGCRITGDMASVYCRHALLGNFVDFEELRLGVRAVAEGAASVVAQVQARFGGRAAFESRVQAG